jgi:hypothetical protein
MRYRRRYVLQLFSCCLKYDGTLKLTLVIMTFHMPAGGRQFATFSVNIITSGGFALIYRLAGAARISM